MHIMTRLPEWTATRMPWSLPIYSPTETINLLRPVLAWTKAISNWRFSKEPRWSKKTIWSTRRLQYWVFTWTTCSREYLVITFKYLNFSIYNSKVQTLFITSNRCRFWVRIVYLQKPQAEFSIHITCSGRLRHWKRNMGKSTRCRSTSLLYLSIHE